MQLQGMAVYLKGNDRHAMQMDSICASPCFVFVCALQNNVAGDFCDECKAGFFHLSEANPEGCLRCFCMGVSSQCASSSWSRDQVSCRVKEGGILIISVWSFPFFSWCWGGKKENQTFCNFLIHNDRRSSLCSAAAEEVWDNVFF